jgi:hypothetical protein
VFVLLLGAAVPEPGALDWANGGTGAAATRANRMTMNKATRRVIGASCSSFAVAFAFRRAPSWRAPRNLSLLLLPTASPRERLNTYDERLKELLLVAQLKAELRIVSLSDLSAESLSACLQGAQRDLALLVV